jgi:uncharacterized RDD family membrane protein YckC
MDYPAQICPICRAVAEDGGSLEQYCGVQVCDRCRARRAKRRGRAFVADYLFWSLLLTMVAFLLGALDSSGGLVALGFLLSPLFCLKDGFRGRSLGKAIFGLQVIDKTSHQPPAFVASLKRNLVLIVPFGWLFVASQALRGGRLGDGWANTAVVLSGDEGSMLDQFFPLRPEVNQT